MRQVYYFLFLLCTCFSAQTIFAQNPGGVTNNLQFWLRPDDSTYFTFQSGKVREWINAKSTGYKLTAAGASQRPYLYDGSSSGSSVDSLNYQPHVTFTASTLDYLTNSSTAPDMLGTAGTIITVTNSDRGNNRSGVTYYSNTLYRYQVKPKLWVQTNDGITAVNNTSPGYVAHPNFTAPVPSPTYASPANNARITVSKGFGKNLKGRINATQPGTLRYDSIAGYCPGIAAGVFIGANPTNSEYFDGKIAEVIFYNTTLADDSIRQIESALAVKYGITLDPGGLNAVKGYVNSSGNSIYSPGSDGTTYWRYIIGLGRDNNAGVYQKQSHQYDDSVRLYTGTLAARNAINTSSITNNTFLMIGSTGSSTKLNNDAATAAEKPASVSIRMDREWKVINTAFTNSYTMTFKLNSSANVWWSTHVLTLLVDDDGNFTNATSVSTGTNGITIAYSAGVITVTINPSAAGAVLPVNSTKYITPAATSAILPYQLLSFDAVKINNNTVKLNWRTAGEADTDYFGVEKSSDKNNWQVIRSVQPAVNAEGAGDYQITDNGFSNDIVYYRIKQVNKSGKVNYSEMRMVKLYSVINNVSVFPNPAKDRIKISWSGYSRPVSVNIYTASGIRVKAPYILNEGYAEINISNLPAGLYVIAVANADNILYGRLLKQ